MPNETLGETPPTPIMQKKDYSALYLPGAIILAGALIAIGLFFGLSSRSPGQVAQTGETLVTTKKQMQDLIKPPPQVVMDPSAQTSNTRFIGKAHAPVTMTYWFDYQCPFCKAVEVGHPQIPTAPSLDDLIKDYVNTGKIK